MIYDHPFYDRFKKIVSDPLNEAIEKSPNAGEIVTVKGVECVNMYNDIKVSRQGYYGNFSDILLLNNGIHEPSEEYVFQQVLSAIKKPNPIMYELGSYWCFYSMSFLKKFQLGVSVCVEAGKSEMSVGIENMALNDFSAIFLNQKVGWNDDCWSVDKNAFHPRIDILHSDIQGYELEMLLRAENYFNRRYIDYVFVSTHSQYLHEECTKYILSKGYHLVADVDFQNTFCEDGIIVAQNPEMTEKLSFSLPKISQVQIIDDVDFLKKHGNLLLTP